MRKILFPLIRAVVLLAYIFAAQAFISWTLAIANQTFHYTTYALCFALASILLGILLRSDVFFKGPVTFHVDWLSLLIIGIPCLILTFGELILITFFANEQLPGFVSTIFWQQYTPAFGGIIFGYTLINSLFTAQGGNKA
jgi:hypothetical protein